VRSGHTVTRIVISLLFSFSLILFSTVVSAINIERFEKYTIDDGLSQNTITSIHCDSKGFLWIGTMNGLNRFDGYNFKVFQSSVENPKILTHNRVISIWEDEREFLWFETYDGYYHYYNPRSEAFETLPKYQINLEEKYSRINYFKQYSKDELWLGASNSGVYRLTYNSLNDTYDVQQFLSRGNYSISNNNIRFIESDSDGNLYIGSQNGLNILRKADNQNGSFYFQHYFAHMHFTAATAVGDEIWMGTELNGIIVYSNVDKTFKNIFTPENNDNNNAILNLKVSSMGNVIVGGANLSIYYPEEDNWRYIELEGEQVEKIYEDRQGLLWVTTEKFGVKQIDQTTGDLEHYDLTPPDYKYLSDKERPYFYEDSDDNFWICVHGGGLASYDRDEKSFQFFRSDPSESKSISSNTVMCITEDKNGTLWVGTGLQGGINKVVLKNPAFRSIAFNEQYDDYMENIVRAVYEDSNNNLWVASKGGEIKIYDEDYNEIKPTIKYPFTPRGGLMFNVYAIFQDSRGYIWLGSKGVGIAVSETPITATTDYSKIKFIRYQHDSSDALSLCDDNIYSFDEDDQGFVWIGTYGRGLSRVSFSRGVNDLSFANINTSNSNLSNDLVRDVKIDSDNNLWVATTFGLNKLSSEKLKLENFDFECFYRELNNPYSITYNDVVHIFEDSAHNMWFGTFGVGVNRLESDSVFASYSSIDGLCNNEVFGIVEDNSGSMWFSTERGLSRFDPYIDSFENYTKSNSLGSNIFSENTCEIRKNGELVFGGNDGFEVIDPTKVLLKKMSFDVVFTNFQLFNNDVKVNAEASPLSQSITYTENIELAYNQSSFSLEYTTLNYLDESRVQYAYFLDNFDDSWNSVGAQRKATYTNLPPGEYTFKIKAALWDGNWDENESILNITIHPPWWQTNTAYIIYLIVFALSIFLVSRGVIRNSAFRTELKIEKAVNEVKLKFFTNVSHEIRTPLTLILGPVEDMLADESLPLRYRSTLSLVQKNGKRMLYLLNQLLDFRKVQNNKMILKVQCINLVVFTSEIFQNFKIQAAHKNIDFEFNADDEILSVWADPHRLDSVIFNLLSNAFKFTPSGGKVLVAVGKNTSDDSFYIRIVDGGAGIKSKDIPLLFNRYTVMSNDANGQSTGIGLNLSNEIVKLHGGVINIKSSPGKGSEFEIILKNGNDHFKDTDHLICDDKAAYSFSNNCLQEVSDDNTQIGARPFSALNATDKPAILVVEDNLQIVNYIADALSESASIISASDGEAGFEMAKEKSPDLIISDIMMPGIDGIEMTRKLKDEYDTCHIPIVLLTAKSSVGDQVEGIESGAEAYIVKPFNMQVLISTIANLLEQRKIILQKYTGKSEVEISDVKLTSRDKIFLEDIVKYIEENYDDSGLTIAKLVEHSCVSRTVFYNKIKSLTGLSPIELLRQIKLKIAAQMLANGYNVNETAFKIGFSDSRYFSKQFKEQFGITPSKYKKQYQNSVENV
jgi:signal transduction histidine kinase/ligand-binding sensor domain-containing protein/DNA-binding response OmpR family regulator